MSAIYLDSCIVIYLTEGPDPFREICYQALVTRKTGGIHLCFTRLWLFLVFRQVVFTLSC